MRVLVACEESQTVCKAFRAKGHESFSCDIIECSGGHPEWHIKRDVREVLHSGWDLVIAHPPCTDLSSSGSRYREQKRKDGRQQKSIDFFMLFTRLDCLVAIENPIGIISSIYRKPDQIVQPWMFGHPESKATCLWLFGLPKLMPTILAEKTGLVWENQTPTGQNKLPPSTNRAKIRSKTYTGIAEAMASQWG